jgi:hypothetical protein
MSWVSDARDALGRGEPATVRPQGGSMRGRIESGQLVTIIPTSFDDLRVDDVVFIRWRGNYLLHLVCGLGDEQVLIGNALGKVNGWIGAHDVLGKVTAVEP